MGLYTIRENERDRESEREEERNEMNEPFGETRINEK